MTLVGFTFHQKCPIQVYTRVQQENVLKFCKINFIFMAILAALFAATYFTISVILMPLLQQKEIMHPRPEKTMFSFWFLK